jgi:hypothetical protein
VSAVVHALKERKGPLYVATCGDERIKCKRLPDDFTAWGSDVTCPPCLEVSRAAHS